jgi:hypothetical protein
MVDYIEEIKQAVAAGVSIALGRNKKLALAAGPDEEEEEGEAQAPDPQEQAQAQAQAQALAQKQAEEKAQADATHKARIAELEAQLAAEHSQHLADEAASYATSLVTEAKALPSAAGDITALYVQLAQDDERDGLKRLDALKTVLGARPAHQLTDELLKQQVAKGEGAVLLNKEKTTGKDGAPMTEERREELLALTPLGQAVLEANAKN